MTDPRSDPETQLERSGDELEERIERLDTHIGEAEKAKQAGEDAISPGPGGSDAAGDEDDGPAAA